MLRNKDKNRNGFEIIEMDEIKKFPEEKNESNSDDIEDDEVLSLNDLSQCSQSPISKESLLQEKKMIKDKLIKSMENMEENKNEEVNWFNENEEEDELYNSINTEDNLSNFLVGEKSHALWNDNNNNREHVESEKQIAQKVLHENESIYFNNITSNNLETNKENVKEQTGVVHTNVRSSNQMMSNEKEGMKTENDTSRLHKWKSIPANMDFFSIDETETSELEKEKEEISKEKYKLFRSKTEVVKNIMNTTFNVNYREQWDIQNRINKEQKNVFLKNEKEKKEESKEESKEKIEFKSENNEKREIFNPTEGEEENQHVKDSYGDSDMYEKDFSRKTDSNKKLNFHVEEDSGQSSNDLTLKNMKKNINKISESVNRQILKNQLLHEYEDIRSGRKLMDRGKKINKHGSYKENSSHAMNSFISLSSRLYNTTDHSRIKKYIMFNSLKKYRTQEYPKTKTIGDKVHNTKYIFKKKCVSNSSLHMPDRKIPSRKKYNLYNNSSYYGVKRDSPYYVENAKCKKKNPSDKLVVSLINQKKDSMESSQMEKNNSKNEIEKKEEREEENGDNISTLYVDHNMTQNKTKRIVQNVNLYSKDILENLEFSSDDKSKDFYETCCDNEIDRKKKLMEKVHKLGEIEQRMIKKKSEESTLRSEEEEGSEERSERNLRLLGINPNNLFDPQLEKEQKNEKDKQSFVIEKMKETTNEKNSSKEENENKTFDSTTNVKVSKGSTGTVGISSTTESKNLLNENIENKILDTKTSVSNVMTQKIKRRILDCKNDKLQWGNTQVIIDIDDTVKSSGGYKFFNYALGGVDTQYQRGETYPGSFQFIFELAMNKLPVDSKPLLLSVLTARIPQVPITEDSYLNKKFNEVAERRGIKNWGIDCENKILYSTLKEWVWNETRGEKKFFNFKQLHKYVVQQNSMVRYIWIGDTGDMDRQAGEMMIRTFPQRIRAVFLHHVKGKDDNTLLPSDYFIKSVPIFFFRTYIGAATKAYAYNLIDKKGLTRVLVQAVLDLEKNKVPSDSSKWDDLIKDIILSNAVDELDKYNAETVNKTKKIIAQKMKEISERKLKFMN